MKWYITFGQAHVHSINGKTFDKDCVAVINGESPEQCDKMAFEIFNGIFHEHSAKVPPMEYYPRGLIEVNPDYLCGCGHIFPNELGKYGCPNCEGDNEARLITAESARKTPG